MSMTAMPDTVAVALSAPEVGAGLIALIVALLGGITAIVKVITRKFEDRLTGIAHTADATHEQVANNHDMNLRDDLDRLSGEFHDFSGQVIQQLKEIKLSLSDQDRQAREAHHEQHQRDQQSEERVLGIRQDLRAATENATRDRELLHSRVNETRQEVRDLASETKRRFTEVDETVRRLHPDMNK